MSNATDKLAAVVARIQNEVDTEHWRYGNRIKEQLILIAWIYGNF